MQISENICTLFINKLLAGIKTLLQDVWLDSQRGPLAALGCSIRLRFIMYIIQRKLTYTRLLMLNR